MIHEYKKIMTPIDGSEASEIAFKKAADIAIRNGGVLYLVHVIDNFTFSLLPQYDFNFDKSAFISQAEELAKKMMETYREWALKKGVGEVVVDIRQGRPRVEIATQLPEQFGIDLIVMGATGMSRFEQAMLGSVTTHVVKHAACDVLVVRADKEGKDPEKIFVT